MDYKTALESPVGDFLRAVDKTYGIYGQVVWPALLGEFSGKLLIAAGGRCIWSDLEEIPWGRDFDVMCVNDIGMHWPTPIKHWYSHHWDHLNTWNDARRFRYCLGEEKIIFHSRHSIPNTWPWIGDGTSGLGSVFTGLALGYEEIVLCGMPLDDTGHYFDPPEGSPLQRNAAWSNFNAEAKERTWKKCAETIFQGKVTSASGRSKMLIGG